MKLRILCVISVLLGFIAYISSIGTLLLALDHMNQDEPNSSASHVVSDDCYVLQGINHSILSYN